MQKPANIPPADTLPAAARMVNKQGLHPGLLTEAERTLALGIVWAALPQPGVWDERGLNVVLKALLADTAAWLDADHVELRRWLVDTGWLTRDGYGREYRRVDLADLPAVRMALAQALTTVAMRDWVAKQRHAHETQRAARRQAWQAAPAKPAPSATTP